MRDSPAAWFRAILRLIRRGAGLLAGLVLWTAAASAQPVITSVDPNVGGVRPVGTVVFLTGQGFTGATAVYFGTIAARSYSVRNDTSAIAVPPDGMLGTVAITMVTKSGRSAASPSASFTYVPVQVTGLAPFAGTPAGGTVVSISGSGFTSATAVRFGATPASSFSIVRDSIITAVTPPSASTLPGAKVLTTPDRVDVTVTAAGVTSSPAGYPLQFEYIFPSILALAPVDPAYSAASQNVGVPVTVTIPGYAKAIAGVVKVSAVFLGTTVATGQATVGFDGRASVRLTLPAQLGVGYYRLLGSYDSQSARILPSSDSTQLLTVYPAPAPTIDLVYPNQGGLLGGTKVLINGHNYTGATAVTFGSVPAVSFTVSSDFIIYAIAPPGVMGAVHVSVTAAARTSFPVPADQFTYNSIGAPVLTNVTPSSGEAQGGSKVVLVGSGLTDVVAVNFGTVPATAFTLVSPTKVNVTAPAGAAGTVDVTVRTSSGPSATSPKDQFTFVPVAISAITPKQASPAGGTAISISGTGFTGAKAVLFGTVPATSFKIASDSLITAVAPPNGPGSVDVSVTTAGGNSAIGAFADQIHYTFPTTLTVAPVQTTFSSSEQTVAVTATVTSTGTTPVPDGGPVTIELVGGRNLVAPTQQGSLLSGAATVSFVLPAGLAVGTYQLRGTYVDSTYSFGPSSDSTQLLTITAPPVPPASIIAQQPLSQTVVCYDNATLSVTAAAGASYQWYFNGAAIPGATAATLVLTAVGTSQVGTYSVVVTVGSQSETSAEALVSMVNPVSPGTYFGSVAPESGPSTDAFGRVTRATAGAATGTVAVSVLPNNSVALLIYLPDSQTAYHATFALDPIGTFAIEARDLSGQTDGPIIDGQVVDGVVQGTVEGSNLAFTAALTPDAGMADAGFYSDSGEGPDSGAGFTVIGTDGEVLEVMAVDGQVDGGVGSADTEGGFAVTTTGLAQVDGAVDPSDAELTALEETPAGGMTEIDGLEDTMAAVRQLDNFSTLTFVSPGGSSAVGFVLDGSAAQSILIRAVGPGLAPFGVTGTLAQPSLTLYQGDAPLQTNTGWSTAANLSDILQATAADGAFSLPTNSADSAILAQLTPGAYSAIVTGADGGGGSALLEIYHGSDDSGRLINTSGRAFVGAGTQALLAGFTVDGDEPKRLLIRAVGPSLSAFGVTNALPAAQLQIFQNGALLATNAGGIESSAQAEGARVGAFALGPGNGDAALVLTLPPGAYNAVVSGVGTATGTALVEIYELP